MDHLSTTELPVTHPTPPPANAPGPLNGIRVVELAHEFTSFAGRLMADGGADVINQLMAGRVDVSFNNLPSAITLIRSGELRPLGLTGPVRSPELPDLPTIAEQGFPGYAATNWYAAVVSSKTPPEIVTALNGILTKALNAPEVRDAYAKQGMETLASTCMIQPARRSRTQGRLDCRVGRAGRC